MARDMYKKHTDMSSTRDRNLIIAKLDSIQVLNTKTIGSDRTAQGQNLVHLDSSDNSAAALSNKMGN